MDVQVDCPCAPLADGQPRHPGGDTVTLRDTLDFLSVAAIRHRIKLVEHEDSEAYTGDILAVLTEGYLLHGIEAWTLEDGSGPVPVSRAAIREMVLADVVTASVVGDSADELYGVKVLLPLLARASRSSPGTPTAPSTSPPTDSPTRRPRPSRPSSTTTTPTAGTALTTTSLGGAYSSSQSSA